MTQPPAHGQQVTLTLTGHGVRTASVDSVDGLLVVLAPTGGERWPGDLDELEAMIEFPGRTSLLRGSGKARRGPRGSIRLQLDDELERVQRREWARAETTRPAQLRRLPAGESVLGAWTLDLSAGGARLAGPSLEIGERIELRIRLDEDDEITVEAVAAVARSTAEGQIGVRIERIDEADRERLVRFVLAQQRVALRMNRRS